MIFCLLKLHVLDSTPRPYPFKRMFGAPVPDARQVRPGWIDRDHGLSGQLSIPLRPLAGGEGGPRRVGDGEGEVGDVGEPQLPTSPRPLRP
jgi:hypothetical protein